MNDRAVGRSISLSRALWEALERNRAERYQESLSEALREIIVPVLQERGYLKPQFSDLTGA
jgi:metal-responsive CopG/Arc/MetJ family transcriptional regulator